MKCENCGDREYTFIYPEDFGKITWTNSSQDQYQCEECDDLILLDYCRGHDIYFEVACSYCAKLEE